MPDYQGNSNKRKELEKKQEEAPKKDISRVTKGEVLVKKKGLGQKFKEIFIATDIRGVTNYVIFDVMVPAFQNMIVDSTSRGIERLMLGSRAPGRYRSGGVGATRYSYNAPVARGYTYDNLDRRGLPPRPGEQVTSRFAARTQFNSDIIVATKEEAEEVLERMNDICDQFRVVTVGDFNSMIGLQSTYVDEQWGWEDLRNARVQQVREGWTLDLPQPVPLR